MYIHTQKSFDYVFCDLKQWLLKVLVMFPVALGSKRDTNLLYSANREKTTMKLKHIDLEPIFEPFWLHLGPGRPLGAILGILGPT